MFHPLVQHDDSSFNGQGYRLGSRSKCGSGKVTTTSRVAAFLLKIMRATLIGALTLGSTFEHLNKQAARHRGNPFVHIEVGEASWYGPGFHGRETSSGETFDQKKMTAAHPSLPMGTKAKVTNLENDKKVEVRINDRGPYVNNRVIDLSGAAASKLDMKEDGTAPVKIEAKPAGKEKGRAGAENNKTP